MTVVRDPSGIVMADGFNILTPGGVVAYDADLLPELKIAWVSQPGEACLLRQVAFELTIAQTSETVLGVWNTKTALRIGGQSYSFYVKERITPLVGCGAPANWVLIRDGFIQRL